MTDRSKVALVIAHPGHELRVYRWLEISNPYVFVLTNGAGRSQQSRLSQTSRVLKSANAIPSGLYGYCSDVELYNAILEKNSDFFISILDQLVSALSVLNVCCVVGDAAEGYNPTHDLCRCLIDCAVEQLHGQGQQVDNFEFPLNDKPDAYLAQSQRQAICIALSDRDLDRKLIQANRYEAIASEVNTAVALWGLDAFRREYLYPVSPYAHNSCFIHSVPWYEHYGEHQVAKGYYQHVLRYREHIYPLMEGLRQSASNRREHGG